MREASERIVEMDVFEAAQRSRTFYTAGAQEEAEVRWGAGLVRRAYPYALIVIDTVAISALFLVFLALRGDAGAFHWLNPRIIAILAGMSVVGLYLIGGYSYRMDKRSLRFISEHAIVSLAVLVSALTLVYSVVSYGVGLTTPRSVVAATLLCFPPFSIGYRYLLARIQVGFQRRNAVCLIGAGHAARDLYRRFSRQGWMPHLDVVTVDGTGAGVRLVPDDPRSPLVRPLAELALNGSIEGRVVEDYVLTVPVAALPGDLALRLAGASFNHGQVATIESYLKRELKIVPPSELTLGWAFEDGFRLQKSVTYSRVKRLSDIVLSILGLLVAAPLILCVAAAQKLCAPGPVFFAQKRVGHSEREFTLYKFRTMVPGSEKGAKYTSAGDSRMTRIGGLLRRFRLDELPQLWNVLRGDMSLIGPRAEWVDLVRRYQDRLPFYHFRHAVKPGITGWAQVNYSYGASEADALEKLCYDLYYVRHYSFVLDFSILVKTIFIVLFARGR